MKVAPTAIPEVLLVEPRIFGDDRGHFLETYHARRYGESLIPSQFVQDNLSHSRRGVLRGLHYQWGHPQGKLVMVVEGEIFDVAVDIRRGSPTFGQWVGATLSSRDYRQLYIPEGFAHGFCVISDHATVCYKCTADLSQQGLSVFSNKLGSQVASKLITVVDDSTLPGKRGSFSFDDEGTPLNGQCL